MHLRSNERFWECGQSKPGRCEHLSEPAALLLCWSSVWIQQPFEQATQTPHAPWHGLLQPTVIYTNIEKGREKIKVCLPLT